MSCCRHWATSCVDQATGADNVRRAGVFGCSGRRWSLTLALETAAASDAAARDAMQAAFEFQKAEFVANDEGTDVVLDEIKDEQRRFAGLLAEVRHSSRCAEQTAGAMSDSYEKVVNRFHGRARHIDDNIDFARGQAERVIAIARDKTARQEVRCLAEDLAAARIALPAQWRIALLLTTRSPL